MNIIFQKLPLDRKFTLFDGHEYVNVDYVYSSKHNAIIVSTKMIREFIIEGNHILATIVQLGDVIPLPNIPGDCIVRSYIND